MATESRIGKISRLNLPNSASVTIGNTLTETALWTGGALTIASDVFTNTAFSVHIAGVISVADTTSIDTGLVLKLKYSTTVLTTLTLADAALDNFSNRPFIMHAQGRISATGASGGVFSGLYLNIATATAADALNFAAHPNSGVVTDLTAASSFSVTATWAEANAGNTLTVVSVVPHFMCGS